MEAKQMELSSNNGTLKRLGRWFVNYAGQLGFLLILIVVLSFSAPSFLKTNNIINVSRQVSVNMIIACAMTIVLISGGIDLSTGSVMAMSGMVSAYLSFSGFPFVFCALAGILTGVFSGLINGLILANTKLPPFIVTYAMQSILRGIVFVATGAGTIRLENKAYLDFGGSSIGGIPLPVLYMIAVIVIAWLVLGRSKMGRHIYAIGGNPRAAQFAGINIKRIVVFIYSLCGACAALAGLVLTSRNTSMQPAVGVGSEMDAIAAVVLGGTSMAGGQGAIAGTIIGAFIIGIINNGLNLLGMDSYYQYICKGIVILIAVYMDDVKNKRVLSGKKL
jgi:ribose transport system permease protein